MQPARFYLTLTALLFYLCSAASLQAQENTAAVGSAPSSEKSTSAGLEEIDRPEGAELDPTAGLPAESGAPGVEIKDANYWFKRGVLLSVYGNYTAAIGAFQQAGILAPQWSSPYFQMGVAFGENGQYVEALDAINKAINLEANRGAYYYGRARIHLMTGDLVKAQDDLQRAAELGDRDARRYLQRQAP